MQNGRKTNRNMGGKWLFQKVLYQAKQSPPIGLAIDLQVEVSGKDPRNWLTAGDKKGGVFGEYWKQYGKQLYEKQQSLRGEKTVNALTRKDWTAKVWENKAEQEGRHEKKTQ